MILPNLLTSSVFALAITVQPPLGQYGVTRSTKELVDRQRSDPFKNAENPRRLMVSIFEPTTPWKYCSKHTEPYMPPLTAATADQMATAYGFPNGTFASIENTFCGADDRVDDSNGQIIIYSHSRGTSRLIHGFHAISLASHGFVVVAVDHVEDAAIVEYPDGTVIRAVNITTDDEIATAITARQQDISLVIDEILGHKTLRIGGRGSKRILVAGHSFGGATVGAAMIADGRIHAGVNLDGSFQAPFADKDIDCPFMLFGSENTTLLTDLNWNHMWSHLQSTRVAVNLKGARHATFTDLFFLATKLGLTTSGSPPPDLEGFLGDIDGERALDVVTAHITTFARFVTGWESRPLPKKG